MFDSISFLGRFHPLLVHLPVGFIILTLVVERWGNTTNATKRRLWMLSFLATVVAAVCGWLLSNTSFYAKDILFWHKWLGIGLCVATLLMWWKLKDENNSNSLLQKGLRVSIVMLLLAGGHFGGSLTHGSDYLIETAPSWIKKIFGKKENNNTFTIADISQDSILTYQHLIAPILEKKCVMCHQLSDSQGGMDMTTITGLKKGGINGEVILAGNAMESELFRRMTLPQSNAQFMPLKGLPLTFHEMNMIKWWINNGADFEEKTGLLNLSDDQIQTIKKLYNIDLTPKPWYEKEPVQPIDASVQKALENKGFILKTLSQKDNYLNISISNIDKLTALGLSEIETHVIGLNLKNTQLAASVFQDISQLPDLVNLELQQTSTNSANIKQLGILPRLEMINLFATTIDDSALEHLVQFPKLKRIYTWQTKTTAEGIATFEKARPDVELIGGDAL